MRAANKVATILVVEHEPALELLVQERKQSVERRSELYFLFAHSRSVTLMPAPGVGALDPIGRIASRLMSGVCVFPSISPRPLA
jgi:hypothetical protein